MQRCVGGGREIDRGVSVCLLLQKVEEVDEEAGFGKSAEGESESDREREADRDRERERETGGRGRGHRAGVGLGCVCVCVRLGSDLAQGGEAVCRGES